MKDRLQLLKFFKKPPGSPNSKEKIIISEDKTTKYSKTSLQSKILLQKETFNKKIKEKNNSLKENIKIPDKDSKRWIDHRQSLACIFNFQGKQVDTLLTEKEKKILDKLIENYPQISEQDYKRFIESVQKLSVLHKIFGTFGVFLQKVGTEYFEQKNSKEKLTKKWVSLGNDKRRVSRGLNLLKGHVCEFENVLNVSAKSEENEMDLENNELKTQIKKQHLEILELEKELESLRTAR